MFNFLDELFYPGRGAIARSANIRKKGFLKKSQWSASRSSFSGKQPQGDREKTRRLRQMERGIIKQGG